LLSLFRSAVPKERIHFLDRLIPALSTKEREHLIELTNALPDNSLAETAAVYKAECERRGSELQRLHDGYHNEYRELKNRAEAGPRAKRQRRKARQDLVGQMVTAGETSPAKIQRELEQHHGIKARKKTVQNDISAVRKSLASLP
jgi:hypothetical protein